MASATRRIGIMEETVCESVIKLCEENCSFSVSGSKAIRKIRSFLIETGYSLSDIEAVFRYPGRTLGSFDGLSEKFRRGLSDAAHFHIQEMNLLTSSVGRALAYGPLAGLGGYLVHQGRYLEKTRLELMHAFLIRLGRKAISTCRRLTRLYVRLVRFTPLYRAPFCHTLWKYAKIDPWPLIQDYIKSIPVDARLSPVFENKGHGSTSCGLIGIDLLPSRGKLFFLESNFNPGHYIERHRLFPEGDTLCNHLVNWAATKGYSRIIFFPYNIAAVFGQDLEDAWKHIAEARGIQLEVVDDPVVGSPWKRSRRPLMSCRSRGVLYVNGRHLTSPLSRLISEKGLLDQQIRQFNESARKDRQIPIPRVILNDDGLPLIDDKDLFPNVIVKNARLDQTKGIILYKSKHLPAQANSFPNIAYEYVVPDLETKEEHGVVKRYVSILRAYLLITPDGPVYMGARKDVSSMEIPNTLSFGVVQDNSPYITNLYAGAYSVPHSLAEDTACRDAVLLIGKVVVDFLRMKNIVNL